MTGGHSYSLTVRTEHDIPSDVLVEHFAVALRDFKYLGKYDITVDRQTNPEAEVTRNHPFEGPEVFDDEPKPYATGGYTGTHGEGSFAQILSPEQIISQAQLNAAGMSALAKFAEIAVKKGAETEALPADPYPLATEAAFQLREARRRDDG